MPTFAQAQDSTITYQRPARVILKLVPLALLDADPTASGAVEVRTGRRASVQGELGYGRPGWNNPNATNQHAGTWRIKTEFRRYTGRYRTNRQQNIYIRTTYPLGNYWAVEAFVKLLAINHAWANTIGQPGPAVPATPAESMQTLIQRNSLSLTYKVGRQFGWESTKRQGRARVLWDVHAGVGLRLINQDNGGNWNVPGYTESFRGMFNRFQADGFLVVPNVSVGIKLGFAL